MTVSIFITNYTIMRYFVGMVNDINGEVFTISHLGMLVYEFYDLDTNIFVIFDGS